jgi:LysR family transcriptional regulator (chromosome initiation inhibitor)
MIDYKLLEALAMVIQEGGFEKAAQLLHLTQSAVSQRVRLLEDRTGKILLSRTTPPRATFAGEQLVKHYLQVKLLEDGLNADLKGSQETGPVKLAVGINADSLASWFLTAVGPLFSDGQLLIDLHVDDQEQTHKLLKEGAVVGCISDKLSAIQGCRVEYLGTMKYRLLASPEFIEKWFANGLTHAAALYAPAVIFSRKDNLHHKFLVHAMGRSIKLQAVHYMPAPEPFLEMIKAGYACGMVPDWQSGILRHNGGLVDVCAETHIAVGLHWHCWNLASTPLQTFSNKLVKEARPLLSQD